MTPAEKTEDPLTDHLHARRRWHFLIVGLRICIIALTAVLLIAAYLLYLDEQRKGGQP